MLAYVGAGAGGISAAASAVSARTNLSAVRRANLPLVYGEPELEQFETETLEWVESGVNVKLYNDGPGTAVEVRVCLRSATDGWRDRIWLALCARCGWESRLKASRSRRRLGNASAHRAS